MGSINGISWKRIYELTQGDFFRWYNTEYRVISIREGRLRFRPLNYNKAGGQIDSFSVKSKMKVEVILCD